MPAVCSITINQKNGMQSSVLGRTESRVSQEPEKSMPDLHAPRYGLAPSPPAVQCNQWTIL